MQNKNIVRFEFTKKDGLKYISHLDLQRAVARIIKRSRIPIRYTEGFNPHPRMVFALPLSVGSESECELLDVYISLDSPDYTPDDFKRDILPYLPKGLELVSAVNPEKPFTDIKSAVYEVSVDLKADTDITERVKETLSSPMTVLKKSKAGDKEVDISPLVFGFDVKQNGKLLIINLELSAAQNEYLNPEYVMTGLKKDRCLEEAIDFYTVLRKEIVFR